MPCWGCRRSENGKFFLAETTIKKSDVFFINSWTAPDNYDNYNEIRKPFKIDETIDITNEEGTWQNLDINLTLYIVCHF